jgi:hypothetical protein
MRERAVWLRAAERSPQLGQFERRLISQRTKEALAAKKAAGIRLGRPPTVPQTVVCRIQRQRARGDSLREIAESLNHDRVPTAQGGKKWYAATVRHVLLRTSLVRFPSATASRGSLTVPLHHDVAFGCGACFRSHARGTALLARARAHAHARTAGVARLRQQQFGSCPSTCALPPCFTVGSGAGRSRCLGVSSVRTTMELFGARCRSTEAVVRLTALVALSRP